MATYCSECGTMIQEGEDVCRRCGTPVGGQPVPVQSPSLFSDLKPYYREEFTKIYESNGKYNGKFNVKAFLAWGPWYMMHLGGGKGVWMLICWIVLICCIPLALTGAVGLLLVGILAGINSTKQYYGTYMKKCGL